MLHRASQQSKLIQESSHLVAKVSYQYLVGASCYGPQYNNQPRCVPTVVTKILGSGTIVSYALPLYRIQKDTDFGEVPHLAKSQPQMLEEGTVLTVPGGRPRCNSRKTTPKKEGYGHDNP